MLQCISDQSSFFSIGYHSNCSTTTKTALFVIGILLGVGAIGAHFTALGTPGIVGFSVTAAAFMAPLLLCQNHLASNALIVKKTVCNEPVEIFSTSELLIHIFSFLDIKTLVQASCVSRTWNQLCEDGLWQSYAKGLAPFPLPMPPKAYGTWMTYYLTHAFMIGPGKTLFKVTPNESYADYKQLKDYSSQKHDCSSRNQNILITWDHSKRSTPWVWDLINQSILWELEEDHYINAIVMDSNTIVTMKSGGTLEVWRVQSQQSIFFESFPDTRLIDHCGKYLILASKGHSRAFDYKSGSELVLKGKYVGSILHASHDCVVLETEDGFMAWDLDNQEELWQLSRHSEMKSKRAPPTWVDEDIAIFAYDDGKIFVYDLITNEVKTFEFGTLNLITALEVKDQFLLINGDGWEIKIFDMNSGETIYTHNKDKPVVYCWIQANLIVIYDTGWYLHDIWSNKTLKMDWPNLVIGSHLMFYDNKLIFDQAATMLATLNFNKKNKTPFLSFLSK